MIEFTCERCKTHTTLINDYPGQPTPRYCMTCTVILSIKDPDDRAGMARALDDEPGLPLEGEAKLPWDEGGDVRPSVEDMGD